MKNGNIGKIDMVTKVKVTLENFYSNLISQHEDRNIGKIDMVTKVKVTLENFYSNLISQHEEREHW